MRFNERKLMVKLIMTFFGESMQQFSNFIIFKRMKQNLNELPVFI